MWTINPNIEEIMKIQYYQPGEGPEEMIRRVAHYVAQAEGKFGGSSEDILAFENEVYNTISEGYWIPSSPFLMNAGTRCNMLSACFVLDIEDDLESIFSTLYRASMIHKTGGGTGFNFSKLRPEGSVISSTGGTSSGVLSFMRLFNVESEVIKQGGRRRAANIAILNVDHPEIVKFIDAKIDKTQFTNFNLSVGVTKEFMTAVEHDLDWELKFNNEVYDVVSARWLYDRIVENNWESSEPGVIYIDNLNIDNCLAHIGYYSATNPCGELPLFPNEACNLASCNLDRFTSLSGDFDCETFDRVVRLILRFLDDAIEVNELPFDFIKEAVLKTRKCGSGIMGLHGYLIKKGLKYNSPGGRTEAKRVLSFMKSILTDESEKLAIARGVPEGYNGSIYETRGLLLRNLTLMSIAPTGTISMILDASSSGCEPIFAIVYDRVTRGKTYRWVNSTFREIGESEGWFSESLCDEIACNGGSVQGIDAVPKKWQELFMIASEISPEDHILMQSALQEVADNSISKTVNMPKDSTLDDVREVYQLAYELGCKGVTIYRDESREGVLTKPEKKSSGAVLTKPEEKSSGAVLTKPEEKSSGGVGERPRWIVGATTSIQSGCGKLWVTINPHLGRIYEVFASTGASGGCTSNVKEIGRLVSLAGKKGIPINDVLEQLRSEKCPVAISNPKCPAKSCSDALAICIQDFIDKFMTGRVSIPMENHLDESSEETSIVEEINKIQGCRSGQCG